jgi:type II secretory pathway component PulF
VLLTRQISDLVGASVPLLRALQLVSRQMKDSSWRDVMEDISRFVQNGGSLSGALARHPGLFSPFYVNMVRTGETGGHLDKVMERLAGHLERDYEIRGKVRSSLTYPLLILGVGILTVAVLFIFVIPMLSVMFDDLDQELPLPTLVLIRVSGFSARHWWWLFCVTIIAGVYGKRWVSSAKGRLWFDGLKLRIPFLGEFIKAVETGRLARTLGTLLENGVPITAALEAVHPTVDNAILREAIQNVSHEVSEGSTLTAALQKNTFFPEMAASMVAVGEEAGRLEESLFKMADTLERQSDQATRMMISLLGPAVLICIVAVVGFAVIAMLLPILRMNVLIS